MGFTQNLFVSVNHLGNVLVTISDKKIGVDANSDGIIDYYNADVITANDFYPFGMQLPGRSFSSGNKYRYGFNGKENDKDAGEGIQDYGMRIYDERLGRFLSVDPIQKSYPELTPYQFASNTPLEAIDLDGLEKYIIHYKIVNNTNVILKIQTDNSIKYLGGPTAWSIPTVHPKVVQFIREDENGKVLNITGEIQLKNFGSTLYVGPWNPKKADGKTDTYDYPAINYLDLAAKIHDKAYDAVSAKGVKGAVVDLETLPADKELVKDASMVIAMYKLGIKDPVNNQQVSKETFDAAVKVQKIFSVTVAEKTVRIKANEAARAVKSNWQKLKDNIQGTIREGLRQINNMVPHI